MRSENRAEIVDPFGRVHDYLRISLTERCNLRCFYCMPEEGIPLRPKAEFMSNEEVLEMAKIFVSLGVKKIRLTGGEPLVRKGLDHILSGLSQLPVELAISTNGILVDQYIDSFRKYGLRSVNLSLDTLKRERFQMIARRDLFDRVFSNLELLLDDGFHVKVNAVVIRGVNDDEIGDFVEWTRNKNVHVRFIEFMPFEGNNWDWKRGVSYLELLEKIRLRYGEEVLRIEDRKNDTSKNYRIQGFMGTFAVISSVTNPFCDSCNRLRLTANGKIKNCLFSDHETDLLSVLRKGEDIKPYILDSVWNKKAVRAGMDHFEGFGKLKNRMMVAIGG